jgi:hypothetical protein
LTNGITKRALETRIDEGGSVMTYIFVPLFFIVYGILYFVFAFREPPSSLARFFRIPGIFIFFPEEHQVRWGRICFGVLFIAGSFLFW